jgi:HAD superfamily phosphatase
MLADRYGFSGDLSMPLSFPIVYVGDTAADMQTIARSRQAYPAQQWFGVGVIPPHVKQRLSYGKRLEEAGAIAVLDSVKLLTSTWIVSEFKTF